MANFRGMDGSITFATNVVAEVKSWSVNISDEVLETTSMGLKWRTVKGGVAQWSGQLVAQLDYGDTLGQKAIIDKLVAASPDFAGTAAELLAAATKKIAGTILITGVAINTQIGSIIEVTITFEGSGQPTITWS